MNDKDTLPKILEVLEENKGEDGWTDIAKIGEPLKNKGIKYDKDPSYPKLKDFLKHRYGEFIEIHDDTFHDPPVYYARPKEKAQAPVIVNSRVMNDKDTLPKILEVLEENKGEDGWTDIANIGTPLKDKGINYKELGYPKLLGFLKSYGEFIKTRKDPDNPLVYYARPKENDEKRKEGFIEIHDDTSHDPPVYYARPKENDEKRNNNLMKWAYMGNFKEVIEKLKGMALKEEWDYKTKDRDYPSPILAKYLKWTFYKLSKEDKIKENKKYAAFNTGLVDKLYEPIYALFKKDQQQRWQDWYFLDFCIAGTDFAGKNLVRNFKPLPEKANYFSDYSEIIYDTDQEPETNWEHIILHNVRRLPLELLKDNKPKGFDFKDTKDILKMEETEKEDYYSKLSSAIEKDSKTFRAIKNRFSDSLDLALKRVVWNYKTAIPMYYPTENKMSLLLPLALVDEETIDLALVIEKTKVKSYIGHTILPLDWAYSNARLITKPDSDWLIPSKIKMDTDSEIDDEA